MRKLPGNDHRVGLLASAEATVFGRVVIKVLRERPFIFWLVLVQLVAVVPLLGFSALLVQHLVDRNTEAALEELTRKTQVAADAVAREADRISTKIQLLAEGQAARSDDIAAVRRLSAGIMETDRTVAGASALDRSGQLVFTTHRPPGDPLPRLPLPPSAQTVFERGELFISGLTPGGLNDVLLLGFAAPWRVGDEVRYILRMSLKPSALSTVLNEQRWPQAWTASLMDQNLRIVARSHDEAKHFNQPASPSLQAFVRTHGAGVGRATTRDGVDMVTVVARVRGTPWLVAAGLPYGALVAQSREPFLQLLAGGLVVVLLGVGLSYALSHRLNRELQRAATGGLPEGFAVRELRQLDVQRLMLNNELVGMVHLKDRRAVWHNRALEIIFGYGLGELDGHSPRLMHADDASFEAFGRRAYSIIRTGKPFRDELEMIRKDGSPVWVDVSGVEIGAGETFWIIVDISAAKAVQLQAEQRASHDTLTGLPNRAAFMDRLVAAFDEARRSERALAVCYLDLNGFKAINDTRGHAAGDELLKVVSTRLLDCVRAHDMVARLGGDEFVLLLTQLSDATEAQAIMKRVRQAVAETIALDGTACRVTTSIGCASIPADSVSEAERLVELADERMYADKLALKAGAGAIGAAA